MLSKQRYISDELIHFVGNNHVNDLELQYLKLYRILKSRFLTYNSQKTKQNASRGGIIFKSGTPSSNKFVNPDMVCFCDIPIEDLHIHIKKYGYFGLSFPKNYIASKGGMPVFYIPKPTPKSDEFDRMIPNLYDFLKSNANNEALNRKTSGHREKFVFIMKNYLSYMKFFKYKGNENDKENYYFEREWRLLEDLKFKLKDIKTIFLPESYAERFRKEFPEFYGQLKFTKQGSRDRQKMIPQQIRCKTCSHERTILAPKGFKVLNGIVINNNGSIHGKRICVECGGKDVDSV